MTKFTRLLHFLCCLFFGFLAYGEEVEKITTPHFSIRCDKKAVSSAQRIANTLETIYHPVSKTLGVHPSLMPLRLNNQSAELNAYFKPVPCHMSFDTLYYSNPYFIGNADWFNMLCIHEFRHAAQHSIEYHSTPWWLKFPYFVWNMVAVCGADSFFKEGDAVGIETALSKSGRGRLPGWEKIYKVNLLERESISFSRQVFGSLKHEMPSEYHIGYYFTTHIRRKYGVHAIQSIFKETMRGLPYLGFRNAFKKVTKKSMLKVYEEMNEELRLSWQKQLEGLKITPATQLTIKRPDDSFDYNGPFIDASGRLIAWKTGIGLRPQLVQVNLATSKRTFSSLRKDKTILHFMPGPLPPAAFAIGEGCAVWLETVQHPWQHNRKTIRLQYYDFKQRKRRTLVSTTRYTALAMSPSTHQLVAVASDEVGKHFLVVLETKSRKVIKKIDNPDNGYYLTPSWAGENDLVVVKTKDQKNSVLRINVATGKVEVLLPYTYEHRSYPKIYKDYLLYNSSYNGIDNIYAMQLSTKACFQVTSRKYGAYLGMVDPISNQVIFNDYTKNGMDIAVMPFDPFLWAPLQEVEDRSVNYYDPLVAQEQNSDILEKVPNALYPLTKYHFLADSLSFIGTSAVPNWHDRGFKVTLFQLVDFEDKLNVTPYFYQNFNVFGITRGNEYKTNELGLAIKYVTSYPVLELDVKGMRYKNKAMAKVREAYKQVKLPAILTTDPYGRAVWPIPMYCISDTYWIPALKLGIKFPYYFDLGSSSGEAYVEATVNLERYNGKIAHTETYAFKISNGSTQSARDICSPWYQSLEVKFEDVKKNPRLVGGCQNVLSFNSEFRMPGIGNHHYFSVAPVIQRCKPPKLSKIDETDKPAWEQRINLAYGLPLAYPECGIPLAWFLQRIWLQGYCNASAFVKFDELGRNFDTIGAIVSFKSRFLSNKNIPCAILTVDFLFCKKKEDEKWDFQFPVPKFDISFYYEARKEVEFTKKTRCIPYTPCNC